GEEGDGGDGVVKVPVRLPASSTLHDAASETSGLLMEQDGGWASAAGTPTRQTSAAAHSRITVITAVILFANQCRNVIAVTLAAGRQTGVYALTRTERPDREL